MFKSISLIATAALIAGAVTVLPALSGQVAANEPQALAKSDRLPEKVFGAGCSQRAWPYYETNCLRDGGQSRQVRVVGLERSR
jgi:hypothetical protein